MLCLPIGLCVKPAFVHLLSAPEELVLERACCCAHLLPGCWAGAAGGSRAPGCWASVLSRLICGTQALLQEFPLSSCFPCAGGRLESQAKPPVPLLYVCVGYVAEFGTGSVVLWQ